MNRDVALDLDECRSVDQGLGLGVESIAGEGIRYGGDRLGLLLFLPVLFGIVELDVAFEHGHFRMVVWRPLPHLLLVLLELLLVRR